MELSLFPRMRGWFMMNSIVLRSDMLIPSFRLTLGLTEPPRLQWRLICPVSFRVTVPYRAQAVGDDDYRLLRAEILDGLHDRPLRDGVQGAGCLIKDQYGRVMVEGAGYAAALPLPAG